MRCELRVVETKTGKVIARYVVGKGYKVSCVTLRSPSEGHHVEKHLLGEENSTRIVHEFTVRLEETTHNEEAT